MVLQKIGTITATVAIINGEERALGPRCSILVWRPRHVQNNRDAVLVVVSLDALMRVRRVTRDQSV